jgi:hypothetical protein
MRALAHLTKLRIYYDVQQGRHDEALDLAVSHLKLLRMLNSKENLLAGGIIGHAANVALTTVIIDSIDVISNEEIAMDYSDIITEFDNIMINIEKFYLHGVQGAFYCIYNSTYEDWKTEEASIYFTEHYIFTKPMYLAEKLSYLRAIRTQEAFVRENGLSWMINQQKPRRFFFVGEELPWSGYRITLATKLYYNRMKDLRNKLIELDTSKKFS